MPGRQILQRQNKKNRFAEEHEQIQEQIHSPNFRIVYSGQKATTVEQNTTCLSRRTANLHIHGYQDFFGFTITYQNEQVSQLEASTLHIWSKQSKDNTYHYKFTTEQMQSEMECQNELSRPQPDKQKIPIYAKYSLEYMPIQSPVKQSEAIQNIDQYKNGDNILQRFDEEYDNLFFKQWQNESNDKDYRYDRKQQNDKKDKKKNYYKSNKQDEKSKNEKTCVYGHPLVLIYGEIDKYSEFYCNLCNIPFNVNNIWRRCKICGFDLCSNCLPT